MHCVKVMEELKMNRSEIFSLACFSKARILKCSSVFFFFRWDLVCRSRVPSEDRGNWG